jgi:hypothetical protein
MMGVGPGATEAWNCLQELQSSAPEGSRVVRLLGNHELYWLKGYFHSRNKKTDTEFKVKMLVKKIRDEVLSDAVLGSFLLNLNNVPVLFTHAGIRPTFSAYLSEKNISKPEQIDAYINMMLKGSLESCTRQPCALEDEVFEAGRDRGGAHIGGPFWTDFSILEKADVSGYLSDMVQVVGHTMAWCYDPSQPGYHPYRSEVECSAGLIRMTDSMAAGI